MSSPTSRRVQEVWLELAERDGEHCQRCGGGGPLVTGHIIPQHVIDLFGYSRREVYRSMTHFLELQCRKCDALQGGRIDWRNKHSKELLQALLDDV